MKCIKLALGCLVLALSSIANAEDCSWSLSGVGFASSSVSVTHECKASGDVIATRVVTVNAKSVPCEIDIASGYENAGSCINSNILKIPVQIPPSVQTPSCNPVFKRNVPGPQVNATYPAYRDYCNACGMSSNSPTHVGNRYNNGELVSYYDFICR